MRKAGETFATMSDELLSSSTSIAAYTGAVQRMSESLERDQKVASALSGQLQEARQSVVEDLLSSQTALRTTIATLTDGIRKLREEFRRSR